MPAPFGKDINLSYIDLQNKWRMQLMRVPGRGFRILNNRVNKIEKNLILTFLNSIKCKPHDKIFRIKSIMMSCFDGNPRYEALLPSKISKDFFEVNHHFLEDFSKLSGALKKKNVALSEGILIKHFLLEYFYVPKEYDLEIVFLQSNGHTFRTAKYLMTTYPNSESAFSKRWKLLRELLDPHRD